MKQNPGVQLSEKVLIATRNPDKLSEYVHIFSGLSLEWLSLADLNVDLEVDESGNTFEENAILFVGTGNPPPPSPPPHPPQLVENNITPAVTTVANPFLIFLSVSEILQVTMFLIRSIKLIEIIYKIGI